MQYVVQINRTYRYTDSEGKRRNRDHSQYIQCSTLTEARDVHQALAMVYASKSDIGVGVGVKVWNGKAHTFISVDDVMHIASELADGALKAA